MFLPMGTGDFLREDMLASAAQAQSIPAWRFVRSLPAQELPLLVDEIYPRRFMVDPSKGVKDFLLAVYFQLFGRRTSKLKCVQVQVIQRRVDDLDTSQCVTGWVD